MRSGKYVAVSLKGCVLRPPWHLGKPITFPSHHRLHASDTEKELQYYPSNALFAQLLPSSFTSYFHSHNFLIFRFLTRSHCLSLCLSRASIVQKRVIYFQDEGSLTIRLCEKGNDSCLSCPSYAAHLFMLGSLITVPLSLSVSLSPPIPSGPPSTFEAEQLSVFHTRFKKKYRANRSGIEKPLRTTHQRYPGNLNILLNFTAEQRTLFYVTCSLSGEKQNAMADLGSCPLPKYSKLLWDTLITGHLRC